MQILRFKPIYQERVWGGTTFARHFHRTLPGGQPIGESWEVVDRPEAQSIVSAGPYAGQSLRSLLETCGPEIMGDRWVPGRRFPILVKWLDCRERLSLQVHPPAQKAAALGGEPKTENWFIVEATPAAALFVGLRAGVTRSQFERALKEGILETCVNRFEVAAGDSVLVRSGTVHAIDAGNLILEIQQNSDTTYRVYDWGRTGLDGRPRQLHLREALESILWEQPEIQPRRGGTDAAVLAECAEFVIRRLPVTAGDRVEFRGGQQPRLLHVVRGRLRERGANEEHGPGDNLLLPFAHDHALQAVEDSLLLVTENFV